MMVAKLPTKCPRNALKNCLESVIFPLFLAWNARFCQFNGFQSGYICNGNHSTWDWSLQHPSLLTGWFCVKIFPTWSYQPHRSITMVKSYFNGEMVKSMVKSYYNHSVFSSLAAFWWYSPFKSQLIHLIFGLSIINHPAIGLSHFWKPPYVDYKSFITPSD